MPGGLIKKSKHLLKRYKIIFKLVEPKVYVDKAMLVKIYENYLIGQGIKEVDKANVDAYKSILTLHDDMFESKFSINDTLFYILFGRTQSKSLEKLTISNTKLLKNYKLWFDICLLDRFWSYLEREINKALEASSDEYDDIERLLPLLKVNLEARYVDWFNYKSAICRIESDLSDLKYKLGNINAELKKHLTRKTVVYESECEYIKDQIITELDKKTPSPVKKQVVAQVKKKTENVSFTCLLGFKDDVVDNNTTGSLYYDMALTQLKEGLKKNKDVKESIVPSLFLMVKSVLKDEVKQNKKDKDIAALIYNALKEQKAHKSLTPILNKIAKINTQTIENPEEEEKVSSFYEKI